MATAQTTTEAPEPRFLEQIPISSSTSVPGLTFLHQVSSTPYYCEENVYMLAKAAAAEGHLLHGVYAAFISNAAKQIPLWAQRSSHQPDGQALWDYHVVLVALKGSSLASSVSPGGVPVVLDVDSTLPLPCPLRLYALKALLGKLNDPYSRLFRLIPALDYLESFASDRSHMLRPGALPPPPGATPIDVAGLYLNPPPPYPCIVSEKGECNTLPRYLEMPSSSGAAGEWRGTALEAGDALPYGMVLTQDAFLNFMVHAYV